MKTDPSFALHSTPGLLCLALSLAGCATAPGAPQAPELVSARQLIEGGAYKQAQAQLLPLAAQDRRNPELQLLLTRIRLDCLTRGPDRDDPAFCAELARQESRAPPAQLPTQLPVKVDTVAAAASSPAAIEPAPSAALQQALARRVTLQLRDASLQTVFGVIGKASGLTVVFDRDMPINTKVSVQLKDATTRAAIEQVTMIAGLSHRFMADDSVLIYPDTTRKQADYQSLQVRSFYLTHADAKFVAQSLRTVLKSRDIVVDEKLNMLVLRDTPEALRQTEQLVRMHDVPEPEVMLDVEVLEVKRTLLEELGVQWPAQLGLSPLPLLLQTPGLPYNSSVPLTLRDLLSARARTTGVDGATLLVNARSDDGDINMLASPRIRAKSREKARIIIGERVPNMTSISTATGFVSESVNYVDVGLKLEVEPQVFAGNEVVIKLGLEVSNITDTITSRTGTVAYRIGTRNANTVLRLKDGENQILAGLIQDSDQRSSARIPGLGALPVIGRLFGSQRDDRYKTEVVLSITPHLIRGLAAPRQAESGFDAGTASSVRGYDDSQPQAAPAEPAPAPVSASTTPPPVRSP
jgi:general secretion pathway protein D